MHCTNCGNNNDADAQFCNNCGKPLVTEKQTAQSDVKQNFVSTKSNFQNNSGGGKLIALPPQLHGWNWGAFFLTWIWGIGNNTCIALLTFIPIVNVVMIFMLGAKGNEWAWQNKRWNNIDHFKKVQKLWAVWGFVLFVLGMLFFLLVIIAAMESY